MTENDNIKDETVNEIIREVIELERKYYFEKRNMKRERRRKLRDIIEKYTLTKDSK